MSNLTTTSKIYETILNDQMVNHFGALFNELWSAFSYTVTWRLRFIEDIMLAVYGFFLSIWLFTTRVINSKIASTLPVYSRMSFDVKKT